MSGRPIFPEDYAYRTLRILHITDCHLIGNPQKQFAGINPNTQFEQVLIHAKRHFEVLATKEERQISASFTWRVSPNSNFATTQQSSLATPVLNIGARTNPDDLQGVMVPPFATPDVPISLGAEEQIFANRGIVPDWLDTTPEPLQMHAVDPESYQVEGISLAPTKLPSPEELSNASSLNLENALNNLSATYPEFAQTLHQISSLHPRVKLLDATRADAEVAEIGGETDIEAIPGLLAAQTRAARIECNTQATCSTPAKATASRQERVLDMIICTGDLIHNTNETPEEKRAAYNLFVQLIQAHFPGIPVFVTPGNHDELEYFDQLANVPNFYVNTHTVDAFNINSHWDLCMLQSKDGDEVAGEINGMHAQLLAQQAGQSVANNKNIFIATHHNLIPTESAWLDQYQLKGREDFLNRLVTIPAIKFLLHGHIHQEQSYSLAMRSVRQHCYTDLFSDSRNFIAHQILIARALGSKELGDLSQRARDAAAIASNSSSATSTSTVTPQESTPCTPDVNELATSIKSLLTPTQNTGTPAREPSTTPSQNTTPNPAPRSFSELEPTLGTIRKSSGLASDTLPQHPKSLNNPLVQALRQANQLESHTPAHAGGLTRAPSVAISNNVAQLVNGNNSSRQIVTVQTASLNSVNTSTNASTAQGNTTATTVAQHTPNNGVATEVTAPSNTSFRAVNLPAADTNFAIRGGATSGKNSYRQYFRASATPYQKPTVATIIANRPAPQTTTDYYPPYSWVGAEQLPTYSDILRNSSERLLVLHQGRDPKSGTLVFHTLEEQHILPLSYAVVQVCPGYHGLYEMVDLERYPEARDQRDWFEVIKAQANLHSHHAHRHASGLPLYFPLQGPHALDTARQELVQRLETQVTQGDTKEPTPDYTDAGLLSLHKPDLLTRINELLDTCKVVADSNGELNTATCQSNLSIIAPESKYQRLLQQCTEYLQPTIRPRVTPAQSAQYVADIGLDQLVTRLTLLLQLEGLTRQLLEKDLFHSQKTSSLGISSIRPTLDSKELCRFALQVLTQLTGNGLALNYRSFAHYELQAFMARQQLSAAIIEDLQRPESREGSKADAWHVYSQINPFVLNWSAEQVWICNRPEVMRGKDGNDFTVTHMPTASFDASEQERRAYDLTTYLFQPEHKLLTGDMLELYARTRLNYQHAAQRLTSYSQIEGLHRQLLSLNYYCVNKNNNSFDNSYVGRCTVGMYQGLTFSRVYLQLLKDLAGFVDTGFSHLLNYFNQVQQCPPAYQQQVVAQLHELKSYLESIPPSHSPALETLRTLFSSIPSVEYTPRTSGSILTAQAEAELMRDYTADQPVDNRGLAGTLNNPFQTPPELHSDLLVTYAQGIPTSPSHQLATPTLTAQGSPLVAVPRTISVPTNTNVEPSTPTNSAQGAPQLTHLQQIVTWSGHALAQREAVRYYPATEQVSQLAARTLQDAQLVVVAHYYRLLDSEQREAELQQFSSEVQVRLRALLAYLGVDGVLTPSSHLGRQITPSLITPTPTPSYHKLGWWAAAVPQAHVTQRAQFFAHHLKYHPYSLRYPVLASHATTELEQLIRLANLQQLFLTDRERTALHELQACLHRRRFYGFNGGTRLILGRKCYWLGFNLHMALAPLQLPSVQNYMPHLEQRQWVGARYLQENMVLRAYAQSNHAVLALQTQPTLAATYGQQLGHLGYRYLTDIASCFTQPLQVFQGLVGYYLPTRVSRDISIRTLRASITDAHNTPSQRLRLFILNQLRLRAQAAQDLARSLTGRTLPVPPAATTPTFPAYVIDFAERLRGFQRLLAQHRGTIADAEELATQASRLAAQNYISIAHLLDQVEAYLEQQHRAYHQALRQATQEQEQESPTLIPAPERLDLQALPYLVQRIDLLAHTNRTNLQNFVDELVIGENNQISDPCLFSDSANYIQETLTYGAIQVANRELDYILNATNLNNGYLRRVFKGPYKGLNWLFLADPGKLGELIYRLDQHNLALDVPDNYDHTTVRLSEPHQARSNLGVNNSLLSDTRGQRNRSYFNTLGIAPVATIAPNVDSTSEVRNQMQFVHLNYDYLQNRWLKYQANPVGLSAPYYQATSNSFTLHRFNLAYARKPVLDDIYRFCMSASWNEIEELLPQLELPLMMNLAYALWHENRALLTQARNNPSIVTTTRLRSGFTAPHDQHLLGADLLPEVETRRGWLAVGAVFIPAPVLNLERYWRVLFNIQIHSTPSTSVQFKPKCNDFTIDQIPPGYRVISLFADGNYNTKVIRLSKKELKMPEKITGY